MYHDLLAEEKNLFRGTYKSFRRRVKDLGDFKVAFSESDRKSILLTLEMLTISRLNMQDMEADMQNNGK